MPELQKDKYNHVVVFSGGGTRFAMYCGMYAALQDQGYAPGLVIGTCGGAIATGIINSFPTNAGRKKYLESEELYHFIRSTKLTRERKLYRIGLLCLKKIFNKKNAPYIEDVFNRYLVEMPEDLSVELPSLVSEAGKNVRSVIVGAKMLFGKDETGNRRMDRKLYRKILFTDNDTARNINPDDIGIQSTGYLSGAVDPAVGIMTGVPMQTALRISLSDMFYVQPVCYRGAYYTGGAIDLVPVELARATGKYIILEKKNRYSAIEEALVRAVLGYSGNGRLKEAEASGADHWMDTRNVTREVEGHYCKKSIDWLRLQVSISLPRSYQQHKEDMNVLWNYGYQCITKGFTV